ncbi:MAG: prolyl oligopeptidase family serine peptidase [Fimbriimonadaceae bacterium]
MNVRSVCLIALGMMGALSFAVGGQSRDEILQNQNYIHPSRVIEDAVMAPWSNNVTGGTLNPLNTMLMISESDGMPLLERVGQTHVNLGGQQIDTVGERDRNMTMRSQSGISVMDVSTGKKMQISIPDGVRIYSPRWSPDGLKIAFVGLTERETALYVADAMTGRSKKVTSDLRMTELTSFDWLGDSKRIVAPVKVNGLSMPIIPKLATGPRVRLSDRKTDDFPTYPDLLSDREEVAVLKYYLTAQIGVIDTASGSVKRIGEPMMLSSMDAGPNSRGFIVRAFEGEFHYMFPAGNGASKQVLLDADGKEVAVLSYGGRREVEIKKEDQPPIRQGLTWRPDGAGLSYMRDEELPKDSSEKPKKQLVLWKAPFGKDDVEIVYENKDAFNLVGYGRDNKSVFISKVSGKKTEYLMFKLGESGEPKKVWETDNGANFYANPGSIMFENKPGSGRVVRMSGDGGSIYLSGTQYFKNPDEMAPRPYVDRVALDGGMKSVRLWQSAVNVFETADMLNDGSKWLINRQSPTLVNQLFFVDGGTEKQITQNTNYVPEVTLAERKRIKVKRDDGIEFWIEATMPKYASSLSSLPAFIWFYPTEFTTQKVYDESLRTYNKNLFKRTATSSVQLMALEGYIVVDADFPITGADDEANNTFPHQLRMNFTAIVDALTEQCGVDRNRMAIGGHSYGAFGTANALVHTSFFKAGIAGDGNYNRTLTPFGFQREPRDLWHAREVYTDMSAILRADQINGALLMYHGLEDQNVGTFPIHSERMFAALEALGKPASVYFYPYEDHGQVALETRLDMWARWMAWLDKYVKNPEVPKKEEVKPDEKTPPPAVRVELRG